VCELTGSEVPVPPRAALLRGTWVHEQCGRHGRHEATAREGFGALVKKLCGIDWCDGWTIYTKICREIYSGLGVLQLGELTAVGLALGLAWLFIWTHTHSDGG
jgi:hypothetical protein